MSRQAEAERERRARIISADGEYQASKRLAAAANVMARDPAALQLRLLQTVVEVAAEKNSTLVMPVPVELLRFFDRVAPGIAESQRVAPPPADTGDAELAAAEAAAEVGGAERCPGSPTRRSGDRRCSAPGDSRGARAGAGRGGHPAGPEGAIRRSPRPRPPRKPPSRNRCPGTAPGTWTPRPTRQETLNGQEALAPGARRELRQAAQP